MCIRDRNPSDSPMQLGEGMQRGSRYHDPHARGCNPRRRRGETGGNREVVGMFRSGLHSHTLIQLAWGPVSYTHLRAHETPEHLVCRLLLEKKKNPRKINI
eukprot:TRINITY_DN47082_c0_g1_i1.p1 TRINITY_DN47082_c0_g1~~TRINITY_DN47082_c0_g1_i1.p1  ORF type:complete len:101 (+),score=15.80 TRINITY_DN47082_c0_g1_i1:83-385(+)